MWVWVYLGLTLLGMFIVVGIGWSTGGFLLGLIFLVFYFLGWLAFSGLVMFVAAALGAKKDIKAGQSEQGKDSAG